MHVNADSKFAPAGYPKLSNSRYDSLDMWRGAACLMIVILHASFFVRLDNPTGDQSGHPLTAIVLHLLKSADMGVPIFFVISGYCISATVDSSRRKGHRTIDYFRRRLRRIYPPFWAALALTILLWWIVAKAGYPHIFDAEKVDVGHVPAPSSLSLTQWIGNLTLTEQWRWHLLGSSPKLLLLGPAWTLCYEEQFYVVCGIILLLAPRRFFAGALVVSALTLGTLGLTVARPAIQLEGFFFDGLWLMFAAGVFVYYHINYGTLDGRRYTPWLLTAALFAAFVTQHVVLRHSANELLKDKLRQFVQAGVFALTILVLRPFDKQLYTAKILKPMRICGQMCYSLYLVHWPINKLVGASLSAAGVHGTISVLTITVPAIVLTALGAGWVFHLLIERRFLNPPRVVAGVVAASSVPVPDMSVATAG